MDHMTVLGVVVKCVVKMAPRICNTILTGSQHLCPHVLGTSQSSKHRRLKHLVVLSENLEVPYERYCFLVIGNFVQRVNTTSM